MIKRLKPVAKLYLLVGLLSAFIIAMGVYGIVQVNAMHQDTRTLYNDRVLPMDQLGDIRFYYERVLYLAEQSNNGQVSFGEALKQVQQAQDSINANWKAYLHTYLTPAEKSLANQVNTSISHSDTGIEELKAALKNADATALHHMFNDGLHGFVSPAILQTDQLLRLQVKISGDVYQDSHSKYRALLIRFIALIVLSLGLVLPFSYYLVKNVKNMIRDLHAGNEVISESEEKYRYLFDHSPAYITVWDPETLALLEVNDKAAEGYGYTKKELSRMSVLDLRRPEEHEKIKAFAKEILKEGVPVSSGRWVHMRKTGEKMLVDITSHQIIYKNRKAVLSLGNDVTDKLKAEHSLQKSEELFRALIDHAADGIFMVTDKGIIFDVNRSAAELFGYSKEELLGMTVLDLHPPEARPEAPVLWERLRRDKSLTDERPMLRKDGTRVLILISRGMLPDASGAIVIIRDISERKNAENQLRVQNEKLLEIAFLQSHIVRRPAANVIGLVNLFNTEDPADPFNRELIEKIGIASGELDEVINQVVKKVDEMGV